MSNDNTTWVLMLLGAALTTWVIVAFTGHLRDNTGPALNEMHREIEAGTAAAMAQWAREQVRQARTAEPFDPAAARQALARANRVVQDALEAMPQAPPPERERLAAELAALEQEMQALSRRLAAEPGRPAGGTGSGS
jgi:uncharacterized membrane protein YccC